MLNTCAMRTVTLIPTLAAADVCNDRGLVERLMLEIENCLAQCGDIVKSSMNLSSVADLTYHSSDLTLACGSIAIMASAIALSDATLRYKTLVEERGLKIEGLQDKVAFILDEERIETLLSQMVSQIQILRGETSLSILHGFALLGVVFFWLKIRNSKTDMSKAFIEATGLRIARNFQAEFQEQFWCSMNAEHGPWKQVERFQMLWPEYLKQ